MNKYYSDQIPIANLDPTFAYNIYRSAAANSCFKDRAQLIN
jgi:hypothetical protein